MLFESDKCDHDMLLFSNEGWLTGKCMEYCTTILYSSESKLNYIHRFVLYVLVHWYTEQGPVPLCSTKAKIMI